MLSVLSELLGLGHRRKKRPVVRSALALLPLVVLVAAPPSLANRRPSKSERKAIIAATGRPAYPNGSYHLVVRITTFGGKWAVVRIKPNQGYEHLVQPDLAVAHKTRGRWHNHGVHCDSAVGVPRRVKQDLGLPRPC